MSVSLIVCLLVCLLVVLVTVEIIVVVVVGVVAVVGDYRNGGLGCGLLRWDLLWGLAGAAAAHRPDFPSMPFYTYTLHVVRL